MDKQNDVSRRKKTTLTLPAKPGEIMITGIKKKKDEESRRTKNSAHIDFPIRCCYTEKRY